MNQIGSILKSRREELGFTLEAMSLKTKVPLAKLKAIEEGNLAYFENEITYVKFYVRYYFNALHLDFDDYKELLDEALGDYSQTGTLKKLEAIQESNQRIKEKSQASKPVKESAKKTPKKPKPKTDVAFVSMFVVSLLIVAALIYVFISAVLPMLSKNPDDGKVVVVPDPITHEDDDDDPVIPEDKILTVTVKDPTHYEVTGYDVGQEITLIISQPNTSSWLGSKVDGVKVLNPTTGFYEKGAIYTLIVPDAHDDMEIEIVIGWVYKQKITLNGLDVPIDKSIYTSGDKTYFTFTFKGSTP